MRVRNVVITVLLMLMILPAAGCGSSDTGVPDASDADVPDAFDAGVPDAFIGQWECEDMASDGQTDTSFYEMYIEEDGYFSMYDAAAGNPGISGYMGNDSGSTVDCEFSMDDFDVPFCWTIDDEKATLDYELAEDTLRLGHNDVWMTFHRMDGDAADEQVPAPLDELITFTLPAGFSLDREYPYGGEEGYPVVEKGYTIEKSGYFSAGILSYLGMDCLGDGSLAVDPGEYIDTLDKVREITVDGETAYIGTQGSDDMPDMVAAAYVQHGDYVFAFRLSNEDLQITEEQMEIFEQIVQSATFKYE